MKLLRFSLGVTQEAYLYFRRSLGRAFREAGLELDRRGSIKSNDIGFL